MRAVRTLSLALLLLIGAYVLGMGAWSMTLKYLDLSNHSMARSWDVLERFAPSNYVAYALIGVSAASIFALSWGRHSRGQQGRIAPVYDAVKVRPRN